ncbi:MAG: hypothetical protein L3J67_08510 [Hyphomicrobiaceae bacterium]|nr:hypothetical protein [Hyphomicrobiaceae bacterium]
MTDELFPVGSLDELNQPETVSFTPEHYDEIQLEMAVFILHKKHQMDEKPTVSTLEQIIEISDKLEKLLQVDNKLSVDAKYPLHLLHK